ncbi:MAG: hypothetical protein AAF602_00595 [Myxococcota bacterium]
MRTDVARGSRLALLSLTLACGGPPAPAVLPLQEWACADTTLGTLVDAGVAPSDAPEIEVGREAYRVNARPSAPGYLAFTLDEDTELRLLADAPDAIAAIRTDPGPDDEWMAIELVEEAPSCPDRTLFGADLGLLAGDAVLEVGPTRQANVWLAVATP